MISKRISLRTCLYLASAAVLLIGISGAAIIYATASDDSGSSLIHDFENSKRYVHSLELYGGKLNVLTDQFLRWFRDLWHGRSLAFPVAFITILVSLGIWLYAYLLPPEPRPPCPKKDAPVR